MHISENFCTFVPDLEKRIKMIFIGALYKTFETIIIIRTIFTNIIVLTFVILLIKSK